MDKTFLPSLDHTQRKWYVIDCKGKQLGRLSSSIVGLLSGKIKPYYHPAFDTGDYVILINAESLSLDSKKERFYVFKPGRPGSALKRIVDIVPRQIIENCIFKMMPNGIAKRQLSNRLKVYEGSKHPHVAQNPIYIDDINNFTINL